METNEQQKPTQEEVQTAQRKAYGWGGIGVSTPDENNVVTIQQGHLGYHLFTEKQLTKRAKRIYPDAKIKPLVFSPDLDKVTPEWIREQMEKHNITQTALARHLGLNQANLNQVINGKVGLSLPMKSVLFYIFHIFDLNLLTFEIGNEYRIRLLEEQLAYRPNLSIERREEMEQRLAEYRHELDTNDF